MPVTPSRVATRHLVPDTHLKVANMGAENAAYLSSLPPQMKSDILRNVAKHYGVSVAEIEDELTDPDAEALYEYIANDNALRMLVYRGFKRAASVKVADSLWDDLGLQDEMAPVLERAKQDIQQDIYGLTQRLQRIERAWSRGDIRALVSEGVLTKSDKAHIDAAWEAQQAGDEAKMSEHLEDVRVDLVKFASERRVGSQDLIEKFLPSHDVYKLISRMEKEGDDQSGDLAARVYSHLAAKLRLSDNDGMALNRLMASVQRMDWDAATQRNNIFKAADLLGMKLPSHFFASEGKSIPRR